MPTNNIGSGSRVLSRALMAAIGLGAMADAALDSKPFVKPSRPPRHHKTYPGKAKRKAVKEARRRNRRK